ncbi:mitochondrial processing peptidase beta subunit [Ascosphaera apis ARSEF 7405]|uniref:mitochondrial processing peptidase n=1 Tax=Ascosphaera apis ARSEF 7405 TaxID=392613 RepID=A0A167YX32_9EURO|nr:mitochondrial processing peptidase beta subunit [Ascosphaera apis ARSEF 7405]
MAARRLAFNFNRALKSRTAVNAIKSRGFASPITLPATTQCTTLSNGLTIATEYSPWAKTSSVGVWIDAGSRAETDETNGTAHFLEHLAFKGTNKRTQHQLELEIENMGAHLNAYTSRESTVYYAKSFNSDVPKTVDILSDILQNSKLDEGAIERERSVILREQEEVDKQLEEVVFDHLHATAFQGQPLGRTILGPRENIQSIQRSHLTEYIKTNYTPDRMVLVGAGGVPHETLVQLAREHFGSLPTATPASAALAAAQKQVPDFIGSDNLTNLDDLVHFTLREWTRLSFNVTEAEVERAKAQLKASILLSLDGTTAIAEDIGRQIITTGRRMLPEEIERVIGKITEKDVMDFAQKKIWDQDVAVSAVGSIEGLLDLPRIRNDMSRNAS